MRVTRQFPYIERTPDTLPDRVSSIVDTYLADRGTSPADAASKRTGRVAGVSIVKVYQKIKSNVLQLFGVDRTGEFEAPEWSFREVMDVIQSESMVRRAVEKYVEQIWKNGYEFVGKNPKTVKYVKERFSQIALVTGKPTLVLFQEVAYSLVAFANVFLTKKRNLKGSGGKVRTTFDKKILNPIAGLFVADPVSIRVRRDEYGNIKKWKQISQAYLLGYVYKKHEWKPADMMHMQDRSATNPMYFFAMPMIVPIIPDIKALREMEELSIVQGIKFATPRYHAKIGDTTRPGTTTEVDQLAGDINALADDAILVTSSRAEIDNVSNGDQVMDLDNYLGYWTKRVRSGLGMSAVGMGDGGDSNRATAQTVVGEMQSTTIKFQQIIKTYLEMVIRELLYEAGYTEYTLSEDDTVSLHIPEIDLENKIKKENHALQLWTSDAISHEELRYILGFDKMSDEDEKRLCSFMIKKELEEVAANNKAVATKDMPTNQHGTQAAKPKVSKD